jgi:hypothetical protein
MSSKKREAEKSKISFPLRGRAGRRNAKHRPLLFGRYAMIERQAREERNR